MTKRYLFPKKLEKTINSSIKSMFGSNSSKYTLELIKRDIDEIRNYCVMLNELVQETDKRTIEEEMEKIRSNYHIDHCWIKNHGVIVGVVKIIKNTFYSLGLPEGILSTEIVEIIEVIERDILAFHVFRIECTIRDGYLDAALHLGYQTDYARQKMSLDLNLAVVDHEIQEMFEIKEYKNRYLKDITLLFTDAYKDGVDEAIGMFNERIAHSAMNSIIKGNFGILLPEFSGIIFQENEPVAAVLVTLLEGSPFIVIIGVRQKYQGQKMGRALMNFVIQKAKERSLNELKLWVTVENNTAYKLYESLGFKEILGIHALVKEFT